MDGIDDPELIERMKAFPPHLVAEAIAYFCAPECQATGEFYDVGGGKVARIAFTRGAGFTDASLTAESLAANIETVRDMSNARLMEGEN